MPSVLTTIDEIYKALGAVVLRSTGRKWWRKAGIQGQPKEAYATIFVQEGTGVEQPVVENVELGAEGGSPLFRQVPWGTKRLEVRVEFFRSDSVGRAIQSAVRFENALRLEERSWDLWNVASLLGAISTTDISSIFRADIEPRAEVRFTLMSNIAGPLPLTDTDIFDIGSVAIEVTHVKQDQEETVITIPITEEA